MDVTVEDNHNLFVCNDISEAPVLAHNCLDENVGKYITNFQNCLPNDLDMGKFYTLANIAAQYSCFPYHNLEFKKGDRATIASFPLNDALRVYACTDVIVPIAIHKQQKARAQAADYKKFMRMVIGQESDKVLSFADMEFNGIPTDVEYMRYLASPQSPIQQEIKRIKGAITESKPARQLNDLLVKENGVPQNTLFGSTANVLKLNKKDHLRRLFFEVLGLKPLDYGADGEGKLDKQFKKTYAKNEIVAEFEKIEKVKKLAQSFVTPFVKRLGKGDMAFDARIRPSLNAVYVVTGRIAETDPNMQQIPNKGLGYHIKRMFVAPPDHLILKCDYVAS